MAVKRVGLMWSQAFFTQQEDRYYQLKTSFKGKTIVLMKEALSEIASEVVFFDVDEPLEEIVRGLKKKKIDFAFNLSVSVSGFYSQSILPSVLDSLHIPYLGSSSVIQAFCLDRALLKLVLRGIGVPTPSYFLLSWGGNIPENNDFPVIIKPRFRTPDSVMSAECVCQDRNVLEEKLKTCATGMGKNLLVERFVDGREMVMGVWGNGGNVQVLPPIEVNLGRKHVIFDSTTKWQKGYVEESLCPPQMSEEEMGLLKKMVLKIYKELDIRDFATFHFIFSEKEKIPLFFEVNPLPSLYFKHSAFPRMCEVAGFDYKEMVQRLFSIATARLTL